MQTVATETVLGSTRELVLTNTRTYWSACVRRKCLEAVLWLLIYLLTLLSEVGLPLLSLPTCRCLLPDKSLCGCSSQRLISSSPAVDVREWVDRFVPGRVVIALRNGPHDTCLVRKGSFSAAFLFALGCGALTDDHAPSQVTPVSLQVSLHFTHTSSLLQSCTAMLCCVSGVSALR